MSQSDVQIAVITSPDDPTLLARLTIDPKPDIQFGGMTMEGFLGAPDQAAEPHNVQVRLIRLGETTPLLVVPLRDFCAISQIGETLVKAIIAACSTWSAAAEQDKGADPSVSTAPVVPDIAQP